MGAHTLALDLVRAGPPLPPLRPKLAVICREAQIINEPLDIPVGHAPPTPAYVVPMRAMVGTGRLRGEPHQVMNGVIVLSKEHHSSPNAAERQTAHVKKQPRNTMPPTTTTSVHGTFITVILRLAALRARHSRVFRALSPSPVRINGALGRTCTCDLRLRRPLLCLLSYEGAGSRVARARGGVGVMYSRRQAPRGRRKRPGRSAVRRLPLGAFRRSVHLRTISIMVVLYRFCAFRHVSLRTPGRRSR